MAEGSASIDHSPDLIRVSHTKRGTRIELPPRVVGHPKRYTARSLSELFVISAALLFAMSLLGWSALQKALDSTNNSWPFWLVLITIVSLAVLLCAYLVLRGIRESRFRQEILVGNGRLAVRESWPELMLLSKWRFDALKICRLRVIVLRYAFLSHNDEDIPGLWRALQKNEPDSYALVAEGADGRPLHAIAVGHSSEVVRSTAQQVKLLLDHERREHHQQLADSQPGFESPAGGDDIPIAYGRRLAEPKEKPTRPNTAQSTLSRIDKGIEIQIPRGTRMEEFVLRANGDEITVIRRPMLGEFVEKIGVRQLKSIAIDSNEATNDESHLVIQYLDRDYGHLRHLRILGDLPFEELCWIAAELREHAPQLLRDMPSPTRGPQCFSIAQLFVWTTLIACIVACFTLSSAWGWLYALQLTLLILCLTSFTGSRSLGFFARRSWNRLEIIIAMGVVGGLAVIRLFAFLLNWLKL